MKLINQNTQILSNLEIDVAFQDVEKLIKTSGNSSGIFKTARETFEKVRGQWEPAALFQWFDFEIDEEATFGSIIQPSGDAILFDFGHSIRFLKEARHVMVSSYTIGKTLETEFTKASSKGSLLEAYIVDLIGLAALEKTGAIIKKSAENQARSLGWGVSPFLSPGSVHGWELEEQLKLCSLLPMDQINVKIREDAVLSPLKSIAALIGIGPGYDSTEVGSTCDVCSLSNNCDMRQDDE